MEGQPLVSYTAGSMNSLVDKLAKLNNPPLAIQGLKDELATLQKNFFHKVYGRRQTNLQVEVWMKHVRELVFDIEDSFNHVSDTQLDGEDEVESFKARVKHACELYERYNLIEEPTDIHDPSAVVPSQRKIDHFQQVVENQTDELLKHLAREQEKRLNEVVKLLGGGEKRLKVVTIFGMEGLGKTTLAKKIYGELKGKFNCHAFVHVSRRTSMITILMEILRKVKSSHKKKVRPKTSNPRARRTEARDLQEAITNLSEFLCTKSYFILVDGLWSTRAWKVINCALPNENHRSRVLTTTCISDVAKCSSLPSNVYQMAALNEEMSRGLYQKTTQEDLCHYDEATKNMLNLCDGMPLAILVTGGLLAMKPKQVTEPNMLRNCVLSSLEHCYTSEGMMKILHMSYAALSLPLKSCFLYLSVFRGEYVIKKDRLLRLWIAEGFIAIGDKEIRAEETARVEKTTRDEKTRAEATARYKETRAEETTRCEETRGEKATTHEEIGVEERTKREETRGEKTRHGERTRDEKTTICGKKRDEESLWEIGERYFNELITRRLIQPVFNYDDDEPMGCTIHGVILDFMKTMSSKGNFVTARADLCSRGSTDTVRRFVLDCYNDEDEEGYGTLASIAVHLSRVRSVTILGGIEAMSGRSALTASGKIKGIPVLPAFRLIRVLDLEDTDHLGSHHLEGIGGLVLLKHLGVAGTYIDALPEEVGELEQLETLDLRRTKLSTLPTSIAKQKRLLHLLIDPTVQLPREILKMQGLEEVSKIGVDSSGSIDLVVELLRKSKCLRVLGIRIDRSHRSRDKNSDSSFLRKARHLFGQVASSTELRTLSLDCIHGDLLPLLLESSPSDQLRRFVLTISAPVPQGTAHKMASLATVTHMDIQIVQLDNEVVCVLEKLPNLVLLKLLSSGRCTLIMGGFKRLRVFSFICLSSKMELEFRRGAMPELQRLSLRFSVRKTVSPLSGMQHLSSLKLVKVTTDCKYAIPSVVKNTEDGIKAQVANFPTVPTTEFTRISQHMMVRDRKAKRTTYPKILYKGCISNFKLPIILSVVP